jgi:hypothetical protein
MAVIAFAASHFRFYDESGKREKAQGEKNT